MSEGMKLLRHNVVSMSRGATPIRYTVIPWNTAASLKTWRKGGAVFQRERHETPRFHT